MDEDLIYEGRLNTLNYMQSKGYFDASVHAQVKRDPELTRIVYVVDKGKRHKVEGVYFDGNRHFDDDRLQAVSSVKKGHSLFDLFHIFSHGDFSEALVSKTVNSIETLYKNAGFAEVAITPHVQDYDPNVDVTFTINEGPQDRVGATRVEGDESGHLQVRSFNLAPGKPYSANLLQMDRNAILAGYFNNGYLNAKFDSSVTPEPGRPHVKDVIYKTTEGPQARVDQVVYLGHKQTRESFLRAISKSDVSRIRPSAFGSSADFGPGAQIGVQEQITGSLLLTFNTDVTATQNTAVQLQYNATQHASVLVLRDENGGYALDVRIRKSF